MSKEAYKLYQNGIEEKLRLAFSQESEITLAASLIAVSLSRQGWIYTSGTGHSHMFAEEIFYRAGGFARIIPILDRDLMLHKDAAGSTALERKEGYAADLLKKFKMIRNFSAKSYKPFIFLLSISANSYTGKNCSSALN